MPAKTGQEWDQAFAEAFNAGDTEGLVALFEPDALWVTDPGQSVSGGKAIAEAAAGYFALRPTIHMTTKGVLDQGDVLVVYTDWTLTATGDDGPIEMAGDSTVVLRRQPDGSLLGVIDDPWSNA